MARRRGGRAVLGGGRRAEGLFRRVQRWVSPNEKCREGLWTHGLRFFRGMEGVGLFLLGSNERTHGLSDSLLSVGAVRAGEVVGALR